MKDDRDTRIRLLLVEDDEAQAALIAKLFSDEESGPEDYANDLRYRVECTPLLAEALARLDEGGIDLVILDLMLPDSSGLDTYRAMRARHPDLPMVILTNCAEEENATKALHEGAQDYISKADMNRHILRRSVHYSIERHKLQQRVQSLSIRDDLTGLYNRRGFSALAMQQVRMERRLKQGLSMIFADVDNLKRINDGFGHAAGDRALIEIAWILKSTFRESDIIARIGGDEFTVLAMGTAAAPPDDLIERLHDRISARNERQKRGLRLTMSVGAMHCEPGKPCSLEEMLRRADAAMYAVKMGANGLSDARRKTGGRSKGAACRKRPRSS